MAPKDGLAERDKMPLWVPRAIGMLMGSVIGLVVIYWLITRLRSFLLVVLLSLFLSFALEPAVNWLAGRGMRRGLATALSFLVVAILTGLFSFAMAALIADQVTTLVSDAPGYIETVADWLEERFNIKVNTEDLISQFTEGGSISSFATRLAGNLVGLGSTVAGLIIQGLSILLITFYLVADGPRLRRLICSLLAPKRQAMVLRGWELAITKTGGYIYSRVLLGIGAFVFHWIVFAIIGIPYPLPLAMWVGVVSQFVPVVGAYLAGLVPGLIALVDDPINAIWVIGAVIAYQQVENYLLAPRITAHTMNIHPGLSFVAVLIGAAVLGATGALLAVPATATIQAFVSTYVKRHELVESDLFANSYSTEEEDEGENARSGEQAPAEGD